MTSSPLRIGVLGTANIARAFIAGVSPSQLVKVTTIASRDAAKAEGFARETGLSRTHSSYEALLADSEIDAVYIPLPNSLHAEWAIRAAEARKHVLCEKPLAATEAEARAMFAAARKHGVQLVEAYPYRAQPQTLKLRELLEAGAIGRPQVMQATIGFTIADPANIRLDAALAGGALMDAGSYPVSLVRMVAGERPAWVQAAARFAESGVDRSLVATIAFAGGFLAQISCSFATGFHRHALIAGDDGVIETSFLNHPPLGGPPALQLKRGKDSRAYETIEVQGGDGFLAETEAFARLVTQGPAHWTGASEAESIDIMATLEAILRSARSGERAELAAPA
ncbi:Predicted dehydrogenase [Rhizobiales bacterium GAS113]|nr:Predicted dehydrogenase [Rhizobiales bacterium GAS113]SEE01851.1 Predicted dehydrogenase [Rhizobiales bacterium GAS188]